MSKRSTIIAAAVLAVAYAAFLAYVVVSTRSLPDPVASHFNWAGHPDSWISRQGHGFALATAGTLLCLLVPGIFYGLRFVADDQINLPRGVRVNSLAGRARLQAYLFGHSLWFGLLGVSFASALQFLVVEANRRQPVLFSTSWMLGVAACFLVGTALWLLSLIRHLGRDHWDAPPSQPQPPNRSTSTMSRSQPPRPGSASETI